MHAYSVQLTCDAMPKYIAVASTHSLCTLLSPLPVSATHTQHGGDQLVAASSAASFNGSGTRDRNDARQ
jgi:hypothetical protein